MSFSVDVWNTIENRGVNSDMETQHIIHNFEPIYNEHSKILMLGTMPSPKSREVGFYYGHPRNRFWKVVSDVWDYGNWIAVYESGELQNIV